MAMAIGNYLTVAETAELLGVSVMRVYQLVDEERLKVERSGRQIYIAREEAAKFAKKPRAAGRPKKILKSPVD